MGIGNQLVILRSPTSVFSTIMSNTGRQPYHGTHRKLVLAFDIGTTFSGISYSILDPGEVPKSLGVRRYVPCLSPNDENSTLTTTARSFPGQEDSAGDSKIPSVICYDKAGHVRAVGAEAQLLHILDAVEDEGWYRVEWYARSISVSWGLDSFSN